jgi:phosphatidylserine/phosphatidylglycerophosphate/cardiolipin synthase-like enzyme
VRYIAALATANTALQGPPPFPVLYGNSVDLMHNKFLVIDAALADRAWVMSGSLNWTTGNMTDDFNNTLFIQDQSLARAYELEFNEMWGSAGAWPDAAQARFGAFKRDDTPHHFRIAGHAVESWFSPSDRVTRRLVDAIASADVEAQFALFSFTRDEPGTSLRDAHFSGVQIRGMIENINDPGVEYGYLLSQNVPVAAHTLPGLLHHKYLVVDAAAPDSDPLVVTGSHNWSYTAEASNDENTLVIYDAVLATLFKAEFERRWAEQNPAATAAPARRAIKVFPNPATDFLTLEGAGGAFPDGLLRVEVRSPLGPAAAFPVMAGAVSLRLPVKHLPAGIYIAILYFEDGQFTAVPFQKI